MMCFVFQQTPDDRCSHVEIELFLLFMHFLQWYLIESEKKKVTATFLALILNIFVYN